MKKNKQKELNQATCCFVYQGAFPGSKNGETEKGLAVLGLLSQCFSSVLAVSLLGWKHRPLKFFFAILDKAQKSDCVAFALSVNGTKLLGKILLFYCRLTRKPIYYFVVGIGTAIIELKKEKTIEGKTLFLQEKSRWRPSKKGYVKTLRGFSHIFVETSMLKSFFETEYRIKNVSVLPNFRRAPIFENVQMNLSKNPICSFVFFARVVSEKGIWDLISAAKRLNFDGLSFSLDVFGDCSDGLILNNLSSLGPNVRYRGVFVGDPVGLLSKYDFLVFPTKHLEGMPGTIVESLMAGTPVISSNFSFANEMIQNGRNGFLFPFCDQEQLYRLLKFVILNRDKLRLRPSCLESGRFYFESSSRTILKKELGADFCLSEE